MAYPYVQAAADYGRRVGPTLAFVVHMAEGGGTVGFLSRPNSRGVSVHYVIEYSGRIVQMLRENRVSGSINPNDLRTTDGPEPFGFTAAKQVLGSWWRNPNEAVITLEIEGFAKDGPNAAQRTALKRLVADVRSRYPRIGLLGHRDFADYKACPGSKIPWAELGGHGPAGSPVVEVADMAIATAGLTLVSSHAVKLPAGTKVYAHPDTSSDIAYTVGSVPLTVPYFGSALGFKAVRVNPGGGSVIAYTASSATPFVTTVPDPIPSPAATVLAPGLYEVKP